MLSGLPSLAKQRQTDRQTNRQTDNDDENSAKTTKQRKKTLENAKKLKLWFKIFRVPCVFAMMFLNSEYFWFLAQKNSRF
jgi:hypothetical protein